MAMLRFANFATVARLHPLAAWTADHDIPSHGMDAILDCNRYLSACHDSGPALPLACPCACQWRRSTEPVGEPLTKATGLNVAVDLRSAPCPIDGLVGDLEKESWKFN